MREGSDITIVSWSMMTQVAMQAAGQLAKGISAEVVDLRSLVPLDKETILNSISKTHRLAIVQKRPPVLHLRLRQSLRRKFRRADENILRITARRTVRFRTALFWRTYVPGPDKVADMIAEDFQSD